MNNINIFKKSSSEIDLKIDHHDEFGNQIDKNNQKAEKVLCKHCKRTSNNGIRCLGICVADNDY